VAVPVEQHPSVDHCVADGSAFPLCVGDRLADDGDALLNRNDRDDAGLRRATRFA
jgi:hypothetical protein